MEAIFLDCGAGGPQLKRNPLGRSQLITMLTAPTPRPRFSERLLLRLSEAKLVDGFWVGTLALPKVEPAVTNPRVEDALTTIRNYDPGRYRRLRRDLQRIWVRVQTGGNTGSHNYALAACELDPRYVLREDVTPSDIASVIVHEATHARLSRCGIGFSESLRNRVEAVCRKQERAFSEHLPAPYGDKIREKLSRMELVREDFWNDALSAQRDRAGTNAAFLYLGTPRWLLPLLSAIRNVVRLIRRLVRTIFRLRAA